MTNTQIQCDPEAEIDDSQIDQHLTLTQSHTTLAETQWVN
jgi:hypothetical protein